MLWAHRWWWIIPTVLCAWASGSYAALRTHSWSASQALLVREEAGSGDRRPGRFESAEAMKTAQETIVEMSRNDAVLAAALKQAGPPEGRDANSWPRLADIAQLRSALRVEPPPGGEFGRSEVIYLTVQAATARRAVSLNRAVCDQLEARLKELRSQRASSLVAELQRTLERAEADLVASISQLQALERDVGSDLGELRVLDNTAAGDSNLRTALNQIKNELRQAEALHEANLQRHELLAAAQSDPTRLVATPNHLLESQPALRRLKDGLVDIQLKTAELLGTMSEQHPQVRAARAAEAEVLMHLRTELESALAGASADLKLSRQVIESLARKESDVQSRLDRLAALRAPYSNLVAEVRQRTAIVEQAQRDLAAARASRDAALSASLISRLDAPQVPDRPVGPSAAVIIAAGTGGGLALGMGIVLLSFPLRRFRGRRWTDLFPGRRASDCQRTGRRSSDRADAVTPQRPER